MRDRRTDRTTIAHNALAYNTVRENLKRIRFMSFIKHYVEVKYKPVALKMFACYTQLVKRHSINFHFVNLIS